MTSEKKERKSNPVAIAKRTHLFPCRTQKLSSLASMVLGGRLPGRVERCRNRHFPLIWPVGQAVKTPPFHGGNAGSIPARVTNEPSSKKACFIRAFSSVG